MPAVTRNNPKLTLEGAQLVLAAAQARAAEIKVPMDIAVVDDGGHLLVFARMDGAKLSSVEIAIRKAHCAAIRGLPRTHRRRSERSALFGTLRRQPGTPNTVARRHTFTVDGICVGAIGVSNGTEDQDVDVARRRPRPRTCLT